MTVTVVGASGFIGSALAKRLAGEGHQVMAVGRHRGSLPAGRGIEPVVTDLGAVGPGWKGADADVAYYLVHSLPLGRGFADEDRRLATTFARAVEASDRLRRIVFVGTVGPRDGPGHLASRHEVGDILRSTGRDVVELRAGSVYGPDGAPLEVLSTIVDSLVVLPVAPPARRRMPVVGLDDLVGVLVGSVTRPPGVYDVATATITYEEAWRAYARARGLRRWFVPWPVSIQWLDELVPALLAPRHRRRMLRTVMRSTRVELIPGADGTAVLAPGDPSADLIADAVAAHAEAVGRRLADPDHEDPWLRSSARRMEVPAGSVPPAAELAAALGGGSARVCSTTPVTVRLGDGRAGERWVAVSEAGADDDQAVTVTAAVRTRGVAGRLAGGLAARRLARRATRQLTSWPGR